MSASRGTCKNLHLAIQAQVPKQLLLPVERFLQVLNQTSEFRGRMIGFERVTARKSIFEVLKLILSLIYKSLRRALSHLPLSCHPSLICLFYLSYCSAVLLIVMCMHSLLKVLSLLRFFLNKNKAKCPLIDRARSFQLVRKL